MPARASRAWARRSASGDRYSREYKVVTGSGSVNGGRNVVKLKAVGGIIRIVRD